MVFIQNKYTNWYNGIIDNAIARTLSPDTYTERHHIIPKSLGGDNSPENLVKLTAREHFICHMLLVRMTAGKDKRGMAYAAWQMTFMQNRDRYNPSSRMYEILKSQLSKTYKGVPKTYASFLNKTHTAESKQKQSVIKKGVNNPMYGRTQSADAKLNIKMSQIGIPKPKFTCEHCGKIIGGKSNYVRYHGIKCKLNTTL